MTGSLPEAHPIDKFNGGIVPIVTFFDFLHILAWCEPEDFEQQLFRKGTWGNNAANKLGTEHPRTGRKAVQNHAQIVGIL